MAKKATAPKPADTTSVTSEGVTTTPEVTAAEPAPTSTESVKLTSPTGSKVTASADAATKLKAQGWK